MSKPRLPLSVLAALGLSAAGVECSPSEVLQPCLSIAPMPNPEDDSDSAAATNQQLNTDPQPRIGPCLTPPMEPPPSPEPVPPPLTEPDVIPDVHPCLSPFPEPLPEPQEPEMRVCLSIAPVDLPPRPIERTDGRKTTPNTVDKAKQAVLKRGILPADVAARLLRDNKD